MVFMYWWVIIFIIMVFMYWWVIIKNNSYSDGVIMIQYVSINSFVPSAPFLYPLKKSEKHNGVSNGLWI